MHEYTKTSQGYFHTGYFGREDYFAPLPKYVKFEGYARNPIGSWDDIFHYMCFINDELPISNLIKLDDASQIEPIDLSGNTIAAVLCRDGKTDSEIELKKLNESANASYVSWDQVFNRVLASYRDEYINVTMPMLAGYPIKKS